MLGHDWVVFGTIDIIVRIISLFYIAHAIMHVRTSQGAIAWVVSILTFPYIGILLYLIFGRRKFHGYAETQRTAIEKADKKVREQIFSELKNHEVPQDAALQPLQTSCRHITHFNFTQGNHVELLINGNQTFSAIIDSIKSAQDYILMQYFIVKNDKIGNLVRLQLIAKAKQGVRVYFIYDEIGSHTLSKHYIASLKENGVHVTSFHTRKGRGNRFQINFRNHRKIVITDGKDAFIGGMNLADEYRGLSLEFGFWRDTFVKLQGPSVMQLQISIVRDWYWARGETLTLNWKPVAHKSNQRCLIMPIGPSYTLTSGTLMFTEIIRLAKKRLWIASPYFVPETTILTALQLAALRGVDVRILLPSRPDHKLVYLCAFSYYSDLKKVGVRMYHYRKGFMHQKVFLVDDVLAGVGTANLDNRSLRINFEVMGAFASPEPIYAIEKMLETDIAASNEVDLDLFKKSSYFFRLKVRSAKLLAPIL